MNPFNMSNEQIDELLNSASKKLNMDKDILKQKLQQNDISDIMQKLNMKNPELIKKIMSDPKLIEKFMQYKKEKEKK